jgi:hypothetical protein
MKVDKEGNLFAAGPGGIYVVGPARTAHTWAVLKRCTHRECRLG